MSFFIRIQSLLKVDNHDESEKYIMFFAYLTALTSQANVDQDFQLTSIGGGHLASGNVASHALMA